MRTLAFLALLLNLGGAAARAATDPKLLLIEQKLGGFEDRDYAVAVEKTLGEFEGRTGLSLRPGELKRCGLKLSSEGGAGLATPKPLVRAITAALLRRGFAKAAIALCDAKSESLRQAGFLPSLSSQADTFEGFPVLAWETLAPGWAADTRLRYENQVLPRPGTPNVPWGDERVSILPKTLVDEVDFWINLPVLSDSRSLGVVRSVGRLRQLLGLAGVGVDDLFVELADVTDSSGCIPVQAFSALLSRWRSGAAEPAVSAVAAVSQLRDDLVAMFASSGSSSCRRWSGPRRCCRRTVLPPAPSLLLPLLLPQHLLAVGVKRVPLAAQRQYIVLRRYRYRQRGPSAGGSSGGWGGRHTLTVTHRQRSRGTGVCRV